MTIKEIFKELDRRWPGFIDFMKDMNAGRPIPMEEQRRLQALMQADDQGMGLLVMHLAHIASGGGTEEVSEYLSSIGFEIDVEMRKLAAQAVDLENRIQEVERTGGDVSPLVDELLKLHEAHRKLQAKSDQLIARGLEDMRLEGDPAGGC